MDTSKKKNKIIKNSAFFRNFSLISFCTSWAFALTAAYIKDFYPAYEAFITLFTIKAIASTVFWVIMTSHWIASRGKEMELKERYGL